MNLNEIKKVQFKLTKFFCCLKPPIINDLNRILKVILFSQKKNSNLEQIEKSHYQISEQEVKVTSS